MAGNEPFGENGLGFAKTIFWERIRKTETNVFEIRRGFGFGFRPRGRRVWEGIRAGLFFGGGLYEKQKLRYNIIVK